MKNTNVSKFDEPMKEYWRCLRTIWFLGCCLTKWIVYCIWFELNGAYIGTAWVTNWILPYLQKNCYVKIVWRNSLKICWFSFSSSYQIRMSNWAMSGIVLRFEVFIFVKDFSNFGYFYQPFYASLQSYKFCDTKSYMCCYIHIYLLTIVSVR